MKIVVIYGTGRKERSTTYHLAQTVIEALKDRDEVQAFFLPKDMNQFCVGCFKCFEGHLEKCLAYNQIKPIKEAFEEAELIIFTVPVYVYHVPGQVKVLLDHFGFWWMVHQLNGKMFHKQALIISTAAGAGMKSAIKDVKDSLDFWGIGRVHSYKKSIWAAHWTEIKKEQQEKIQEDILKVAAKIRKRQNSMKPRIKVKLMFYGCRWMQRKIGLNDVDVRHWEKMGWLDKVRPWKNSL